MNKIVKRVLIGLGILVVVLFAAFKFMQSQTKKASPEATVVYKKDGTEVSVFYCRPSKKGREIFGGLLPYGEVWRTGANEATTFTTSKDLSVGGQALPAGTYTLWTIPAATEWTIIFNSKQYDWGVSLGGKASREPAADVLQVKVPVDTLSESVEMFTIAFDETAPAMTLAWDKTKVAVPLR
jgi:hypothetical protein